MDMITTEFVQNVMIGIGGAIIVLGGGLMGMRKYFREWSDETAAGNVASANAVATEAIQMVTSALRNELTMMAQLYQEATGQRTDLMQQIRTLQEKIGNLEKQVARLGGIEEENTRLHARVLELKAECETLKSRLQEQEHLWTNHCLLCAVTLEADTNGTPTSSTEAPEPT